MRSGSASVDQGFGKRGRVAIQPVVQAGPQAQADGLLSSNNGLLKWVGGGIAALFLLVIVVGIADRFVEERDENGRSGGARGSGFLTGALLGGMLGHAAGKNAGKPATSAPATYSPPSHAQPSSVQRGGFGSTASSSSGSGSSAGG